MNLMQYIVQKGKAYITSLYLLHFVSAEDILYFGSRGCFMVVEYGKEGGI